MYSNGLILDDLGAYPYDFGNLHFTPRLCDKDIHIHPMVQLTQSLNDDLLLDAKAQRKCSFPALARTLGKDDISVCCTILYIIIKHDLC